MRLRSFVLGFIAPFSISLALVGGSAAQTLGVNGATNPDSSTSAPTVTFTTLVTFGGGNGKNPDGALAQGTDGNFYGVTLYDPRTSDGFAFEMTPTGAWSLLDYSCIEEGCNGNKPYSGMVLAGDGNFYGTTSAGGDGTYSSSAQSGTVFRVNLRDGLTTVYSFCSQPNCEDGDAPQTSLTLGSDGNFYGTTVVGGSHARGSVFTVTPLGQLTTLYSFCLQSDCTDGSNPNGLIQAADGNFYGTTMSGGTSPDCKTESGCGTVFRITPEGALSTIYSFCQQVNCTDGYAPEGPLIQAADGNLYGTTLYGSLIAAGSSGTAFKISLSGKLTLLYAFCSLANCADGYEPYGLTQATDGNFYGTTRLGGVSPGGGTFFRLTATGTLTTLYDFCALGGAYCPDGSGAILPIQGTDGDFYGTTFYGGVIGLGTAYKLSTGLGPFVRTVTNSGKPGSSVIILGTDLSGTTKVTFNGAYAPFTIVSNSEITATVPGSATSGPVFVAGPTRTLKSNQRFNITE
jgi:uncharacterized repeat protein (TIGR03803 family)